MSDPTVIVPALDFCRELIVDHQLRKAEGDSAVVIPVVFDAFEAVAGIVGSVVRAHSGDVVLATAHQDGCDASVDVESGLPDLVAAIRGLTPVMPDLTLDIDGKFARLVSTTGSGYSDAQDALRGLVAALFRPDLRSAELAVLVFDAGPLDEVVAEAVWNVLLDLARLLHLPDGHTIVIGIGDGRLDIPLHCTGPTSIRFHIRERDLLVRRTWASCAQEVSRVGRLPNDDAPLLVIFTGAGASRHLGLPLGNDLRDQALNHLLDASWSGRPPEAQARQFFEELKNVRDRLLPGELAAGADVFVEGLTLERVLREEQYIENQRNSHTLRAFAKLHAERMTDFRARLSAGEPPSGLASVLGTGRRIAVVTVNFDHGVETELEDQVRTFFTEKDLEEVPDYIASYRAGSADRIPYIKLHGDIDDPGTIVANVDDTAVGMSGARISAIRALRDIDAAVRPWVYVGYSMRDLDVNTVLGSPEFADRTIEWWVNPFVDPGIRRFVAGYRLARWRVRGAGYSIKERVITLTANDYFAQLAKDIMANAPKP